jgi:hypothetical protein
MKGLVIGGGQFVWNEVQDTETFFGKNWWDICVAANDVGVQWPRPLDAWVTLHPEKLTRWREEREKNGFPRATEHVARHGRDGPAIDRTFRHPFRNGSTGLLAVAAAMDLGATKVICCGVPMTISPYFNGSTAHPDGKVFSGADTHWQQWLKHANRLDGIVKSMSGRTRTLLGSPTKEWLEEIV